MHCPDGNATDPIWRVLASSDGIPFRTPLKPQHSNPNPNRNPLANQLYYIDFLNPPTPLIIPHRFPTFLESLLPIKKTDACTKKVWKLIECTTYIILCVVCFLCLMAYQPSWVIQGQIHHYIWTAMIIFFNPYLRWFGVYNFLKVICLKVNVIARWKFELAYFEAAVQYLSHDTTGTPPHSVGFGSLFNGISNFVGYLMPKLSLLNTISGTIYSSLVGRGDKRVYTCPKKKKKLVRKWTKYCNWSSDSLFTMLQSFTLSRTPRDPLPCYRRMKMYLAENMPTAFSIEVFCRFRLVLWHINYSRLFNAKSFFIHIY